MSDLQVDRAGAPEEALLLDFLHHCTATQAASLVPGPATMCTLRTLAQRSAAAFDSAGVPDLALEALALMEAFEQPGGALQPMKTELAASALLRLTIGRRSCWPIFSLALHLCFRLHDPVSCENPWQVLGSLA